ncbi:MAG TPA: hypothetical protein VNH15_07825 [Elusimicrobiota bacterium]|nr:hypothetical protein [Elusimicrobiota bacterium]
MKISRLFSLPAFGSCALAAALCAAAAGQSFSAPKLSVPKPKLSASGTAADGAASSDRLRIAAKFFCLDKSSFAKIKGGLDIGPEDLHPCTGKSPGIYVARCVFTEPGGAIYQEHVSIGQMCPEYADALKDYNGPVPQFQCDYLHAMENGQGVSFFESFNGGKGVLFPYTLAQQKSYLAQTYCDSAFADRQFLKWSKEPDKINDAYRLAIKTFFWQHPPIPLGGSSYLVGGNPSAVLSWYPYLRPLLFLKLANEANEQKMVRAVAGKMKTLQESGLNKVPGGYALARVNAWLDSFFDHSKPSAANPAAPADPASPLILPKNGPAPDLSPMLSKPEVFLSPKFSQYSSPPLPSLDDAAAVKEENFGARGISAAAARLENEYKIDFWHYFGMSRTIGNPGAALQYAIQQKSGTCGVESQYEALRAHGVKDITPAAMAQEAYKNGWYGENDPERGVSATFTGTLLPYSNKLLAAHGMTRTTIIYNATTRDLEDSLAKGGGAIVALSSKRFWENKPGPVDHAVYVSGAELGSDGKIWGYYVNDTGTGEGMRFVPAQEFEEAWENHKGNGFMVSLDPNAKPPKVELKPTPEQLKTYLK